MRFGYVENQENFCLWIAGCFQNLSAKGKKSQRESSACKATHEKTSRHGMFVAQQVWAQVENEKVRDSVVSMFDAACVKTSLPAARATLLGGDTVQQALNICVFGKSFKSWEWSVQCEENLRRDDNGTKCTSTDVQERSDCGSEYR